MADVEAVGAVAGVNDSDERSGWWSHIPFVVRVVSHAAVWVGVLTPMVVIISKGWIAAGDNAAIATRSYQALTFHPPLVGLPSAAGLGLGHYLYDPGPLEFWLLAVPVHIDTTNGLFLGASLLAAAVLSVAIEAIWSTKLWLGCALVAFTVFDLLWLTPAVFENLPWNAYFPIPFFIATIALAWVVGTGRFGWWPVMVFVASVASQSHLLFVIPCVALTVVAPLIGVVTARRPARLRWLVTGLVVGVASWIAPMTQELGSNGNLSALLTSNKGQTTLGLGYGLRFLAGAGSPDPIWLAHEPITFIPTTLFVESHSAVGGVIVLLLLALLSLVSWKVCQRQLAALAAVSVVVALTTVINFSMYPQAQAASIDYLVVSMWVVGILMWSAAIWAVVAFAPMIVHPSQYRRARSPRDNDAPVEVSGATRDGVPGLISTRHGKRFGWVGIAAVCVLCVVGVTALWPLVGYQPRFDTVGWDQNTFTTVDHVASSIEQNVKPGPVVFVINSDWGNAYVLATVVDGVAWQLKADGWSPGQSSFYEAYTGLAIPTRKSYTKVTVSVQDGRVTSLTQVECAPRELDCQSTAAHS